MNKPIPFRETRLKTLEQWQAIIALSTNDIEDQLCGVQNNNSLECVWQKRAREKGFRHINLFCSLGAWANQLTDIFTDKRFDKLYGDARYGDGKILMRWYNNVLLVVSEYFEDFQEIYSILIGRKNTSTTKARRKLSSELATFNLIELFEFINRVVKHKTNDFHQCNNHLIPYFLDQKDPDIAAREKQKLAGEVLAIKELNFKTRKQYLFYPTLQEVLLHIQHSYKTIDDMLRNEFLFGKICMKFENQL